MDQWGRRRRLQRHDYRSPGEYFVTFCTEGRRCILAHITPEGASECSGQGKICLEYAAQVSEMFPGYSVEAAIIMPNHVHALIGVKAMKGVTPAPLGRVIGWWKGRTTKAAHEHGHQGDLWQKSFHDHIVRDEADRLRLLEYIVNNPKQWQLDCLYREESENLSRVS